jgi:hypothetical protein
MESKSLTELDWMHNLHTLDMAEDDKERVLKVLKYCEVIGTQIQIIQRLVECSDIIKSQSWVNFLALSLNNPTLVISFTRNQNLSRQPFHHLVEYCKIQALVVIVRVCKVSTNPTSIKKKI